VSNLQLRLLTAAVGLPLVVAAILAGGWVFALIFAAVIALAAIEFGHGWLMPSVPLREALPQLWTFVASGIMVGGTHADTRYLVFGLVLAAFFALAGYAPTRRFGPRRPYRIQAAALIYLGLLGCTFVLTRDAAEGRSWILLGILGTFAVDTGAYAVGRAIGRHKMAPKISPGKTWEGAVGGYAAGIGAVLGLNALLDTGVSAATLLPFALVMPALSQAGDLFESGMKRRMGVKDASGFLPGHGGFLDRLDSLLFVVPALYVFLRLRVL
jgi:phosphatidate cytidylyltransferase